ncbi:LysR family transcriptional regulator [Arthrobacter sp. StoSoilB5]|nr:LysR family transcriptional regulator [Arthrobacter sp. StoSoilB5]
MDLKDMLAFRTLADELHFGRAAQQLEISQPALSQKIRKLEDELNVQLLTRTSRDVGLTQIGELFLQSCRRTLAEAERARETVLDARDGLFGRLVIGCLGAAANGPVPDLIRRLLGKEPGCMVELQHFLDAGAQVRAVVAGNIDIGFVRSAAMDDKVVSTHLLDESFKAFMPEEHPLAARTSLKLVDLREQPMVFLPREYNPSYHDLIVSACRSAGFEPLVKGYATSLETQLALTAANVGIALLSTSNANISRTGVVAVDIDPDDIMAPLWMIHARWRRSRLADLFIDVVAS